MVVFPQQNDIGGSRQQWEDIDRAGRRCEWGCPPNRLEHRTPSITLTARNPIQEAVRLCFATLLETPRPGRRLLLALLASQPAPRSPRASLARTEGGGKHQRGQRHGQGCHGEALGGTRA